MSKPEDVSQWAWDEADTMLHIIAYTWSINPPIEYYDAHQGAIARSLDAAKALGQSEQREVDAGKVETLIESLEEGIMTDSDINDDDRRAMRQQIDALEYAAAAIRGTDK